LNFEESSNKFFLVIKCIESIFDAGLDSYTFYSHNLGKFDIIFILKILLDFNSNINSKANASANLEGIGEDADIKNNIYSGSGS
jgi:hypothetical protein